VRNIFASLARTFVCASHDHSHAEHPSTLSPPDRRGAERLNAETAFDAEGVGGAASRVLGGDPSDTVINPTIERGPRPSMRAGTYIGYIECMTRLLGPGP
jgi:hypothetical protein